jgi:hypothetical protein
LSDAICILSDSGCTIANVLSILNDVGVHPRQSRPYIPGEIYEADVDILDVPLVRQWNADHVIVTAIYNGYGDQVGVKNTTKEDHILDPGIVRRVIVKRDGALYISTVGTGAGWLGGMNNALKNGAWRPVDDRVIEEYRRQFQ